MSRAPATRQTPLEAVTKAYQEACKMLAERRRERAHADTALSNAKLAETKATELVVSRRADLNKLVDQAAGGLLPLEPVQVVPESSFVLNVTAENGVLKGEDGQVIQSTPTESLVVDDGTDAIDPEALEASDLDLGSTALDWEYGSNGDSMLHVGCGGLIKLQAGAMLCGRCKATGEWDA